MKNYIRMNNSDNILSLGNLFNTIKKLSKGNSAMQTELFCILFNVKDINPTTVNNYCIGIRAIGIEYKRKFIELEHKYKTDQSTFIDLILALISILDEHIYHKDDNSLHIINNNHNLRKLCVELLTISKNDRNISNDFVKSISQLIDNKDLYSCIIMLTSYVALDNKQPIYTQEISIKINKEDLDDYLKIKLYEGVSYITSLIELSKKDNIYACADLGSLEFDGLVSGKPNYEKSFSYYLKAADKKHPKACWMIANMILTKKFDYDFDVLWKYLNMSIELGSSAGLNTMGLCYQEGINPENKVDTLKAKEYFELSSEQGYTYAFNNLGKMYENDNNIDEAIKYYKISADMGESWALNKVGEYYRNLGDKETALYYYIKSNEAPLSERCKWSEINIKKYY